MPSDIGPHTRPRPGDTKDEKHYMMSVKIFKPPFKRYSLIHKIVSRIVVFEDRLRVEFNRDGVVKLLQEAGMEAVNE